MTPEMMPWVIGGLIVLAVALFVFAVVLPKKETSDLKQEFGREYEDTVQRQGDRKGAEAELKERRDRVDKYSIRSVTPEEQQRFSEAWRAAQALFVDEPVQATRDADRLVAEVMVAKGYPVHDLEQQAADLSVHHGELVSNYRAAHAIAMNNERGSSSTEELRKGFVHYRALFAELLERDPVTMKEER